MYRFFLALVCAASVGCAADVCGAYTPKTCYDEADSCERMCSGSDADECRERCASYAHGCTVHPWRDLDRCLGQEGRYTEP
jgi:hypothetical protein